MDTRRLAFKPAAPVREPLVRTTPKPMFRLRFPWNPGINATDSGRSRHRGMNAPHRLAAPTRHDLGQLYAVHHRAVRASLIRWGVSAAEADDVCAEVFIVALHRLPTFEGHSSLSTWLLGIARNLASDLRRSARARCEVLVDTVPEHVEEDGVHERVERAQVSAAVRRAVSKLKPTQRQVVTGYVLNEQPMNVVASNERVPAQTAYARLYAAQGALRSTLAPLMAA